MSLSLDEFVAGEIKRIQRFAEYWRDENAVNAKNFPLRMEDGQEGMWREMLDAFGDEAEEEPAAVPK